MLETQSLPTHECVFDTACVCVRYSVHLWYCVHVHASGTVCLYD